jgi:DNA repair protein RadC
MKNSNLNLPFIELRSVQSDFPKVKISESFQAAQFIRQFYSGDIDIFESSFILLLNRQNLTIGFAKLSQGGINSTIIDPRIVAHYAVKALATSVILCHNHPSGNLKPSEADLMLTKKVYAGLELLDIALLDHIILTSTQFYSLADNEELK